jgi:hypothetical protein
MELDEPNAFEIVTNFSIHLLTLLGRERKIVVEELPKLHDLSKKYRFVIYCMSWPSHFTHDFTHNCCTIGN